MKSKVCLKYFVHVCRYQILTGAMLLTAFPYTMFPSYPSYRPDPIFKLDGPSVSFGPDFFQHNFCNGEGLERSDSKMIRSIGLMEN